MKTLGWGAELRVVVCEFMAGQGLGVVWDSWLR